MSDRIISQKVLNETTGELETQDCRVIDRKSTIRGGFKMIYKSYDDIQAEVLKSGLDIKIFLYIREKFTYMRVESILSARDIAKELNTSTPKVSVLMKELVDKKFLKRVHRGIYRMNPFMFLPYKSDGVTLQKEWNSFDNPIEVVSKEGKVLILTEEQRRQIAFLEE